MRKKCDTDKKSGAVDIRVRCLIYVRVSSQRQVKEGDGLNSQAQRCKKHAQGKGYLIEKVFPDKGISGKVLERPGIRELLNYLEEHSENKYVIIIDDLKRLARDVTVHKELKIQLSLRGAKLECPNFNFDESPEGEFIETIIAGTAELERKQNQRQVIQKQRARLDQGHWPFCPPKGYIHIKDKNYGKVLVPREPYATIYREAFEMFANDLLLSEEDVRRYINYRYKENGIDKPISRHGTRETLTKLLYSGYVEYPPWQVLKIKGKHKALVDVETFERVQDKLFGRSKRRLRKDYSSDFPLRGTLYCDSCQRPLRGSWNKGRTKKYPNYHCATPECKYRYKVTKTYELHPQFEKILSETKIPSDICNLAEAIFNDVIHTKKTESEEEIKEIRSKLKDIDSKIKNLLALISKTNKPTLLNLYEGELESLIKSKNELNEDKILPLDSIAFNKCFERVIQVLEDPIQLWESDNLEDKRTLLQMYFDGKLYYDYKEGLRTTKYNDAINLFNDLANANDRHVEMRGSEPLSVTEQ